MQSGRPVIGTMAMTANVEMAEILAHLGLDFLFVDQMFTSVDWRQMADIVRAAQGSDMAVMARIENDPWHSADDPGITARIGRALAVGVDGVKVNVYSKTEAEWSIRAGAGWHRRPYIAPFAGDGSAPERFAQFGAEKTAGTLIIPSVESELGIRQTDDILELPGLRAFGIALTDTAIMLGHPMDYEHPDVWRFVDRVAQRCKARGVHLVGGTGLAAKSWDDIAERVSRMRDHGFDMIFLQTPEFLFQLAMTELLGKVRATLAR